MSERTWTVLELLRWTQQHFAERGIENARLDAECLLAAALERTRIQLYVDFEMLVGPPERARFRELVLRRANDRVPVAQLLGEKEFWSLPLRVSADVLCPRPETETLVEAALAALPDRDGEYRILDVGTGSGAIALALAQERPKARVLATDVSQAALQIAGENAEKLHLSDRIRLLFGAGFEPVGEECFDAIVSNPPYLARSRRGELPPELAHEPDIALFGGDDGLEILEPLAREAGERLVPGGFVALEIDPGQSETVSAWLAESGLDEVRVLRDLARRARVAAAKKPGEEAARAAAGPSGG